MTKDDCNFHNVWDYNFDASYFRNLFTLQKERNNTLITKINQISAQINQSSFIGGATNILTSKKIQPLIESLEYSYNGMLLGRYTVTFENPEFKFGQMYYEDIIYVFNNKVKNITIIPYIIPATDESFPEIEFCFPKSDTDLILYKQKLCGCITILNYN
jgi:hypothetical protein